MAGALPSTFASFVGERSGLPLEVVGTLPRWLRGTLLRNGPGRFEGPSWSAQHVFDGLALLQRFSIEDGGVRWSARFLDSPLARQVEAGERVRFRSFGGAPPRTWFDIARDMLAPSYAHNANVSIHHQHGRVLAMTETPYAVEIDPRTLGTRGVHRHGDERTGMLAQTSTAHPLVDRERDRVVNLSTMFAGRSRYYRLWRWDGTVRTEFARLPVVAPAYLHSFGMSRRHVVVAEFPLLLNPLKLLLAPVSYIGAFRWKPQAQTRLRVVSREDGTVVADVTTDAGFAFHHINAWDDGREVVVDCCVYPDARVIDSFALDALSRSTSTREAGRYLRWRIDCDRGVMRCEQLLPDLMEFVSVAPARQGLRARYAYAVGSSDRTLSGGYDQLLKIDAEHGSCQRWREPGTICAEPLFIPDPGADPADPRREDAGVVIALCHRPDQACDLLLVLDAQSWTEIARALLPGHVPYGFHGCFLWDSQQA